jgi:hypothetical protein
MDVYLTRAAMASFRALSFLAESDLDGYLLGHRRGARRIIEYILPTRKGFFPTLEAFAASDRVLRGAVIGFFSFRPKKERLAKILAPFAFGRVLVDVSRLKDGRGGPRAFVVEFDRTFRLRPVACVMEKGGSHV